MPYKDKQKQREYSLKYYCDHKLERLTYMHKRYEENKTEILERVHERQQKLKREVLSHYSDGKLECAHCGEKEIKFLSIDHSFGDGAEHRKQIGDINIYRWLRKNKCPSDLGLRVLCMNCNFLFGGKGKRKIDARIHLPKCSCCGEDRLEVLLLVKNHNKVLCRNCEHPLRWYGYCPHQKKV